MFNETKELMEALIGLTNTPVVKGVSDLRIVTIIVDFSTLKTAKRNFRKL